MTIERDMVIDWLAAERLYQEQRFPDRSEHDDKLRTEGIGPNSFWWNEVTRYIFRADRLGLQTPLGRQAAAKAAAVAQELVASVIRVYGHLPAPGVQSGEIDDL